MGLRTHRVALSTLILAVALLINACGGQEATPTPAPVPEQTRKPTNTPLPTKAVATPSPQPTPTVLPTPTSTPASTPTPAPTPTPGPPAALIDAMPPVVARELDQISGAVTGTFVPGTDRVVLTVKKLNENKYWDGAKWQDQPAELTPTLDAASGGKRWLMKTASLYLSGGVQYQVLARVKNSAGYESWPSIAEFTYQPAIDRLSIGLLNFGVSDPEKVQLVFSLRDRNNDAVVRPLESVEQGLKVFESGQELEYRESGLFVKPAENFELEVVLVLDFTLTMKEAIGPMLDGARAVVEQMGIAHRVAIVEYHDRNDDPKVVQPFTTNQSLLKQRLDEMHNPGFIFGSTRAWDAVATGMDLFSNTPNVVKALVFLSDGRDTSSRTSDPAKLRASAVSRGVALYPVAFGEKVNDQVLKDMALNTGGVYFSAGTVEGLTRQMQKLADNLAGQYAVSYLSLTGQTAFPVKLQLTLEGQTAELPKDLKKTRSDDRIGQITVDRSPIEDGKANVFVRARHVPRTVKTLRFRVDTARPFDLRLVSKEEGGILDGWRVSGPDAGGYYELASDNELPFGVDGILFQLTFRDISEPFLMIPLQLDNNYIPPVRFQYPALMRIGPVAPSVSIDPLAGNVAVVGQTTVISGTTKEAFPGSKVLGVTYRFDGEPWKDAQSIDAAFDSSEERFKFNVPGSLSLGRHKIEVRARNEEGYWSSPVAGYLFDVVPTPPPTPTPTPMPPWRRYDFNDGNIPGDFQPNGQPWRIETNAGENLDGFSIRSGSFTGFGISETNLVISPPSGSRTVSFFVKVSSASGYDLLTLLFENAAVQTWSGEVPWTKVTFDLPGTRPLLVGWKYSRNGPFPAGKDAAWIDSMEFR